MIYKDNPLYRHAFESRYVTCEYACLLINPEYKHVLEFGVIKASL